MQELLYTSAPEGLKPGQQGFCTVATTANIPKPLWDRLEAISGYRHQFDPDSGRNPVAWAHWLVQVGGREVSVLSRVCDAGLDYTRRTNSFAHNLALDADERTPAGPAWMLAQNGVMLRRWDGVVGNLGRPAPLPRGDVRPAVCSAWKRLTGDAGWAGVLAETASKNARRPVCILFDAGQDMLPLMSEAVALLPQRLRWQVTFNTYFTSLPASAQCAWRCCLAGTPAAAEAMRHAAGWLVLDLANPSRMGELPGSTWIDLARTGEANPAHEPAVVSLAPNRTAKKTSRPAPIALAEPKVEEPPFDPPPDAALWAEPEREPAGRWAQGFRRTAAKTDAEPPIDLPPVQTSEVDRTIDTSWGEVRRRVRRRWVAAMVGLAVIFVGAGTWLQVSAYRQSSSRELSVANSATEPTPLAQLPPPPEISLPPLPAATRVVAAPQEPVIAATAPVVRETAAPTPVVAAVRPAPQSIELSAPLEPPSAAGAGIRDRTQTIAIPLAAFDDVRGMASFQLLLSGADPSYLAKLGELSGTLSAAADPRGKFRQIVAWRDLNSLGALTEVALIQLDPRGPKLEITWRTTMLLRRPDVVALARAVLQRSTMVVADEHRFRPQSIRFKPAPTIVVDVGLAKSVPTAGPDWPPGVSMRPARGLPEGWRLSWGSEWDAPDAKRTSDTATTVLRFDHGSGVPGATTADAFDVRIAPGWKSATSTLPSQRESAKTAESHAAEEVHRVDEEITAVHQNLKLAMEPLQKEFDEARAQKRLPLSELQQRSITPEEALQRVVRARAAITDASRRSQEQIAGIMPRREEADRARLAWQAAVESFDQVKDFDVSVELPDGLVVSTIRVTRSK